MFFAAFVVQGFPPWGLIQAPAAGAIGQSDECNAPRLSSGHERSAVATVVLLFKWARRLVAQ
jgi:hypothetical protein